MTAVRNPDDPGVARRLLHAARQVLKPLPVAVARAPGVQLLALRSAYLGRFHSWCAAHPSPNAGTAEILYQRVHEQPGLSGAILYLEFGVYCGESLRWWTTRNRHPDSIFVGFDTFWGLPEDWTPDVPRGTYSTEGHVPSIPDPRCRFVGGMFQQTLLPFLDETRLDRPTIVHMDADLYSSTAFVMLTLVPRLRSGDVILFDEFQDYLNEFRAFDELCAAYPIRFEVLGQNGGYTQLALRLRDGAPTQVPERPGT